MGYDEETDGRGSLNRLSGFFPRSPSIQSVQSILGGLARTKQSKTHLLPPLSFPVLLYLPLHLYISCLQLWIFFVTVHITMKYIFV